MLKSIVDFLNSLQAVLVGAATILVVLIYRAYLSGGWVASLVNRIIALENENKEIKRLLEAAGGRTSDLATKVQGQELRFELKFALRELVEEQMEHSIEDRKNLWRAIERLRDKVNEA